MIWWRWEVDPDTYFWFRLFGSAAIGYSVGRVIGVLKDWRKAK